MVMIRSFTLPSIGEVARLIDIPVGEWPGRCHEISYEITVKLGLPCRLCYGHYYGPVSKACTLRINPLGFQRHGWLEAEDKTVIDPTRWVFEAVVPYIYHGKNIGHYDEGGDKFREFTQTINPIPGHDADPKKVPLTFMPGEEGAAMLVTSIFGQRPEDLNLLQVGYLANMSRASLGVHIVPIYRAIERAGHLLFIPLDNRLLVLGRKCSTMSSANGEASGR